MTYTFAFWTCNVSRTAVVLWLWSRAAAHWLDRSNTVTPLTRPKHQLCGVRYHRLTLDLIGSRPYTHSVCLVYDYCQFRKLCLSLLDLPAPAVQLQSQQSSAVVFHLPAAPVPTTLAVKGETFEDSQMDTGNSELYCICSVTPTDVHTDMLLSCVFTVTLCISLSDLPCTPPLPDSLTQKTLGLSRLTQQRWMADKEK